MKNVVDPRGWCRIVALPGLRLAAFVIAGAAFGAANPSDHEGPDPVLAVQVPQGIETRSTAILFAGTAGWSSEHAARAEFLARSHSLVVGVDGARLLDAVGADCAGIGTGLADLVHAIQADAGVSARAPVLVAIDDAADLALAAARSAPSRFKGLVTEGYAPSRGQCALDDLGALGGKAPVRWLDLVGPGATSRVEILSGARGVSTAADPRKTFYRSYFSLAGTDAAFDTDTVPLATDLSDIPITMHDARASAPGDTYAIFLSGDGGWAHFDEEIADRLAEAGVPVIGISSLRYLWRERRPEEIAADLTLLDDHFAEVLGRKRLLIVGFSFGANVLPFALAHVPKDLRSRIAGTGLISPERRTGFEIVFGGWLGRESGARDVGAAIGDLVERGGSGPVSCLYGRTDRASVCPDLEIEGLDRIAFEGGHHLGKSYDRIVRHLLDMAGAGPEAASMANGE